jgi:hypothetical protein
VATPQRAEAPGRSARSPLGGRAPLALQGLLFAAAASLLFVLFPTPVRKLELLSPLRGLVTSPFTFPSAGIWILEAEIDRHAIGAGHLTIRAKECVERIELGEKVLLETSCVPWLHWFPFRVELPPPSAPIEKVRLRVRHDGGLGLVDIRQAHGFDLRLFLFVLAGGAIWLALSHRLSLDAGGFWTGAAPLLLGVAYQLATDPWARAPDIDGHRAFVAWLLREGSIPPVTAGWSTWHPPLYYLIAAGAARIWQAASVVDPARGMQAIALLAWIGSIWTALLLGRRRGDARPDLLPPLLLLLVPASLFVSARIGNDALLPLLGLLSLAAVVAAARTPSALRIAGAALLLAAGAATKGSFLPVAGGACLFFLYERRRLGERLPAALAKTVLLGIPAGAWIVGFQTRTFLETGRWLYTPAAAMPAVQILPNSLRRFALLDLPALFREGAFLSAEGKVRESWPTSLVASAATGEYDFSYLGYPLLRLLAPALLPVALLVVAGLFAALRRGAEPLPRLAAIAVAAQVAFLTLFLLATPYTSCHDVRLFAPVFGALALLAGEGRRALVAAAGNRKALAVAVRLSAAPFLLLAAGFAIRLVLP